MNSSLKIAAIAGIVMSACSYSAVADGLWTELSFEQAKAKAMEEDRILLAYATASWCPPCKQMERTTWVDDSVAEWFEKHGIAFKFDVDENRELSKELGIRAMPTLLAYREGELFDRVVGGRSAEQLLSWLDDVREGRSELQRIQELAGERVDEEGKVDIRERLTVARTLAESGELDQALQEYLWLWDNMLDHEPSMVGVRGSFMLTEMTRLAARHSPAREAFKDLRDRYARTMAEGNADRDTVMDWIHLEGPAGETDSVIKWFDEAKDDPKQRPLLALAEHQLRDRLVADNRWAELALLYPDPIRSVRAQLQTFELPQKDREELGPHVVLLERMARRSIMLIYAAMLAADEESHAEKVASMMLEVEDTIETRQSLASIAMQAGEPRLIHLQWLDEAIEMGAHVRQLRKEIAQLLADSHT